MIGPRVGPFKIGIAGNVKTRRSIANVGNPQYLFVHYQVDMGGKLEAEAAEREAHYHFAAKHIRGEWFNLTVEDLPNIRQVVHNSKGRGRDEDCSPPPAQIRTCGTTAYGSCLES